ncbi:MULTISPECIES: succinate dehydrogenase cytochrome b subunit [Desulfococcus]|uniref:Succinate dehydrogenase (Or fumarate reductase) cytochrome b subunit, b558 family n=1 Tax=Desulfococcus multivorans DSM 2059 TaxID=1121405 RepID=S7TSK7_DESML|nr:succinate dehydrogenase cytochrome b subunit [Desulfococcus multivorans]AOY59478.1 SdhC: succinate dehydrogenase/fumarate reductase cytochrome b subunit [Desulfococcus multivorans]AQV01678.1 succinate dehydrogenase [Desulfococcus multivorans]EPR40011.1 succinate dehydrogenase (or fumarate reductase) cytochrome b subunit, b558 family [Desulfococcus multivorans DSM 2059]SKA01424.1 succinate dehydrogenase subunit C [Desulfococcus multivorans DSM 2059]
MNWIAKTVGTSIGKKLFMALTGLGFIGFLSGHLAGNLTIYGGKDAFNSYAEHLHSLGPLITLMELGLLTFAVVHVGVGLYLFYQNYTARPVRYAVNKSGGGRTIGSQTMPYTGILMLLFIIFHLLNFHFVDKTHTTIFEIVSNAFSNPLYVITYVAAMIVVAVHVSHGFWSAFQTLGANHPKYMPIIHVAGIAFSILVGVGFGFIPIYVSILA